jgi:SAM-dependent methyltransferase
VENLGTTLWRTWGQPPEEERHALSAWRSALFKPRNKQPRENKRETERVRMTPPREPAQLLTPELLQLMDHEKGIEHSVGELGWHLVAIQEGRLYRAAGFGTFDDYCLNRWGWRRRHAYRMIDAAKVRQQLELCPNGHAEPPEVLPESESQMRPLTPIRDDPDSVRAAWDAAVEAAGGDQPTAKEVAEAVQTVTQAEPPTGRKRDLGDGVHHPAVFSEPILPILADLLEGYPLVLDPFAGTGRIHQLADLGWDTVGVEIEPEWAHLHPRTRVGNALVLDFGAGAFDAIATSPTYGNRMADHHKAYDPQTRRTYTHDLGRQLHSANSGAMQWGDEYRAFHQQAWLEAVRVLRHGGRFVLNIKDHIRDGRWADVTGWHVATLVELGLTVAAVRPVVTGGFRMGANSPERVDAELVIALDRP